MGSNKVKKPKWLRGEASRLWDVLDEFCRESAASPEAADKALKGAGLLDKNGKLKRKYRR